jgi:hypothetical protein
MQIELDAFFHELSFPEATCSVLASDRSPLTRRAGLVGDFTWVMASSADRDLVFQDVDVFA